MGLLFESSTPLSMLSPAHVFSDDVDQARSYLSSTSLANATFHDPNSVSVVQAIAIMVAAEVFVGSRSDMSSSSALMRIGLFKTGNVTFMPSEWTWAHVLEAEHSLFLERRDS